MPILGSIIKTAYSLRQFPTNFKYNLNPGKVQKKELRKLLATAQDTAFGEHYKFRNILESGDVVSEFQKNIAIHDYNSMFKNWWYRSLNGESWVTWPGRIKYFALTSGTSESSSKHIPVTQSMLSAIRRASIRQLMMATKYDFKPEFYEKGILMIGGSTHLQYNGKYYVGDLSGITASNIPFWFQHFYKPGKKISREDEWSVKLHDIVAKAPSWDIGVIVGVPAWIQIILEKIISEYKLNNIHDIWPNLSAYVHSGVSFSPYRSSFEKLMGRSVVYNESYLASEGYIAFQYAGNDSMSLILDNGIFYEFVPYNESNFDSDGELKPTATALSIDKVEEGIEYALLLSTCAGAWRYLIGDVVRFSNKSTCQIVLTGRTKHFLSICGEHISQENMTSAVKMLQDEMNIKISEFTVTGIKHGSMFAHKWYLGTNDSLDPKIAALRLDHFLKILNDDYRVERIEAIRDVSVEILPLRSFYDWLKIQGKEGGAHKFPRVLKNDKLKHWEEHIKNYL